MRAFGIAFSARKRGNCLSSVEYVLTKLEKGFETEVINFYDYEIRPCSHCNYECFAHATRNKNESCPIQDDVSRIYGKMREADAIILAVPTYGGKAASIYCAFTERAQGVFKSYGEFKTAILSKVIALIVIGNIPSGGDLAYHTIIFDHKDCEYPLPSLLLQPTEYDQDSLRGTLIENENVRSRLDNLASSICIRAETRSSLKS
jgi:multimeric flavodoxin WrbA